MNLDLSIIIPVCNEAGSIPDLSSEIAAAMDTTRLAWETVWVDDRSTDGTPKILESLAQRDPRNRIIQPANGKGQSAALVAGFLAAQAPILATMDGDGQNDPQDIPRLYSHLLSSGVDMVNGQRVDRKEGPWRLFVSWGGNWFRNFMTGERLADVGCALRVFDRHCIEDISMWKDVKGLHRFIPTVSRTNKRGRMAVLDVKDRLRVNGTTKYTVRKRLPEVIRDSFAARRILRARGIQPPAFRKPPIERRRRP